jgi:phospholipid/cholesterol/gamma-HCH transport system ATP-binding protein
MDNGGRAFEDRWIVRGLQFEIHSQDRFFIIGKSGMGKSVLMKLLTGLIPPSEGTIWIDDHNVTRFTEEQWNHIRRKFGVVFQGAALFDSLNIFQNTGIRLLEEKSLSLPTIKEQVIYALEQVGLSSDILYKLPAELSGGMRKRVGIARAIIHQPQYLFYDEPLAGLDPISSELIDDLILDIALKNPQVTTIVISHDMYSVKKIATQVLLLHDGVQHFLGSQKLFFQSDDPVIRSFLQRSL